MIQKNQLGVTSGKKRTYEEHQTQTQVSALQVGQAFRSKADFHGYWSQCLKVRVFPNLLTLYVNFSSTRRPLAALRRSGFDSYLQARSGCYQRVKSNQLTQVVTRS